jgi:HlyD family secretion protein
MEKSKFNILYLLFPAALGACAWIAWNFQGKSAHSFFGIAETDPQVLNFDHDIAVKKCFVKEGDFVKKGDTLAILDRVELNRQSLEKQGEITRINAEIAAERVILSKEKELVQTRLVAKKNEILAQIRLLRTEDSLKTAFRKSIYEALPVQEDRVAAEKMAALQKEIANIEAEAREEIRLIDARLNAKTAIAAARIGQSETALGFIGEERERLYLISPIEGYVEDIFFSENALLSAHRDLIKLNPLKPNRVVGFLHEAAAVPLRIGQKVQLASSARPAVTAEGILIGSNPKLTELPLRLRKFVELRSWGREIYIQTPGDNQFFISEKIIITFPED